jgi:spore maturation protein CgeB
MLTRVLVVLPFYGGSLPVGRHCIQALRDNNCLVEVFEAPNFFKSFEALKALQVRQERMDYLENNYLGLIGDAILAQVERFQPDLVFAMAQAPLSRKTLERLRHDGVPTIMWFMEDYRLFVYWRAYAQYYDFFAVIQREHFLDELSAIGVKNAFYLPMAALPQLHRPLKGADLSVTDRQLFGADLSFMGAGYPNRRAAFRKLTNYDFKIWGTEWENDSALEPYLRMKGVRISPEEAVRIFNAAKINLNLHSSVKAEEAVTFDDFVNPRTFEIACCGAFQLVDERTLLPELFAKDELVTFNSMEDLQNKINYYLQHEQEREAIAEKGRARVLKEHSYQARMKTLLDFVASKLPDWPESRQSTDWRAMTGQELPQELCAQLDTLAENLQLPPEADFKTVITALRQRTGKLSSLESALLFLDEWKKQYAK